MSMFTDEKEDIYFLDWRRHLSYLNKGGGVAISRLLSICIFLEMAAI